MKVPVQVEGEKCKKNALSGPRVRNGWGSYDEHFGTWNDEFEIGISSRDLRFNVWWNNFCRNWLNELKGGGLILKPPRISKIRWNRRKPQWLHGNSEKTDAEASKETRNPRKLKQDFVFWGKIKEVFVFLPVNPETLFFFEKDQFDARNRKIDPSLRSWILVVKGKGNCDTWKVAPKHFWFCEWVKGFPIPGYDGMWHLFFFVFLFRDGKFRQGFKWFCW